ncbi:MAG: hypothetical protein JRJ12_17435 [Deltaproteobacteria bacterium]|nr:hypothetical protein [Deltaproteobacteria bacterium]MBW2072843.1 hypothetical protein [Deltaproteobacteria bacterium]
MAYGQYVYLVEAASTMKLRCPEHITHRRFIRESYDSAGKKVNVEIVDEHGRLAGEPLDLYTGDVRYKFFCAECGAPAVEMA